MNLTETFFNMRQLVPKLRDIKIGNEVLRLEELLNADYDNVAEAALQIPAAIAWLSWKRGVQYKRVEEYKRRHKEAQAETYFALKNGQFEALGYGSKPTEAALSQAILLDDSVKAAAELLEEAHRLFQIYAGQLDALQGKLEMVRTSEATRRRLIEGIPDEAVKLASTTNQTEDET